MLDVAILHLRLLVNFEEGVCSLQALVSRIQVRQVKGNYRHCHQEIPSYLKDLEGAFQEND